MIFREGDLANRFYLILDGCVALEATLPTGGTRVIDRIGPGEVLGWSWMLPPFRWHFSARALIATKAVFVYGTWLLECCEARPGTWLRSDEAHGCGGDWPIAVGTVPIGGHGLRQSPLADSRSFRLSAEI